MIEHISVCDRCKAREPCVESDVGAHVKPKKWHYMTIIKTRCLICDECHESYVTWFNNPNLKISLTPVSVEPIDKPVWEDDPDFKLTAN